MSNTNVKRMSVREYDLAVYEYFETNKDSVCSKWKIPPYNPTDMKKKFLKWGKKNNDMRFYDIESKEPILIFNFLIDEMPDFPENIE